MYYMMLSLDPPVGFSIGELTNSIFLIRAPGAV